MKKALSQLPADYKRYVHVDLTEGKKERNTMTIISTVSIVCFSIVGYILNELYRVPVDTKLWVRVLFLGIAIAAAIIYIDIHEFIHGIFIMLFSRRVPIFKFNTIFARAKTTGIYFTKGQYVLITIAPVVLIGVALLVPLILLEPAYFVIAFIPEVVNLCSSIGDMYIINKTIYMPKTTLVHDGGDDITYYVPSSVYNEVKLDYKIHELCDKDITVLKAQSKIDKSSIDVFAMLEKEALLELSGDTRIEKLSFAAMHNETVAGVIESFSAAIEKNDNSLSQTAYFYLYINREYENKGVAKALITNMLYNAKRLAYEAVFCFGGDVSLLTACGFTNCADYALTIKKNVAEHNCVGDDCANMVFELKRGFINKIRTEVEDMSKGEAIESLCAYDDFIKQHHGDENARIQDINVCIKFDGSVIAGLVGNVNACNVFEVMSIFVNEKYRRMGYGKKLLQVAERRAKEAGVATIRVVALDSSSMPFFKAVGYLQAGHFLNQQAGYEEFYYYKKL